ncbi:MAG: alanine--glyoxylate aminotransferase family protein [archaeon GBS-70-058]|nr:alanine--glyoxylate aminotransferase family protein [Candidatus Culexarchaeum nevadense]
MNERFLLMIPGPTIFEPSVLRELSITTLSHTSKEFIQIFDETLKNLRKIVFVDENYKTIILAGSGTLAMETSTTNFIKSGEKVLVVSNGYFGDRMIELLSKYPVKVDVLKAEELGSRVETEKILEKLDEGGYSLITVTHVDTSTGVKQELKSLGKEVRKHHDETLLVVDGVCSVAGEELYMKDWGIDILFTGSQKALGVPPGLAILWLSPKAMEKLKETKSAYAPYYMDLNRWIKVMEAYEELKPSYFATPAVNLIMALNKSLKLILEEGMERRFGRHKILSKAFRAGVKSIGLNVMAKNEDYAASTVTAIHLPQNIEVQQFLAEMQRRNVIVAGGPYPNINYFRVGHMGPVNANDILATMGAIERSLHKLGIPIELGKGLSETQNILANEGK